MKNTRSVLGSLILLLPATIYFPLYFNQKAASYQPDVKKRTLGKAPPNKLNGFIPI
jgi:hypothetical protein